MAAQLAFQAAESLVSLSMDGLPLHMLRGTQAQTVVTAVYSDGSQTDVSAHAVYESGNPSVAAVSAAGTVSAVGAGRTIITATYGGKTVKRELSVFEPDSIGISGLRSSMSKGEKAQASVLLVDGDGGVIDVTAHSAFESSNPSVAAVSASGETSAEGYGSAVITAVYGAFAPAAFTISVEPVLESIAMNGLTSPVYQGAALQLAVLAVHDDGSFADITGQTVYASTNPEVASVSASGQVKALKRGRTVIQAVYEGRMAEAALEVIERTPEPESREPDAKAPVEEQQTDKSVQIVTADDLKPAAGGQTTLSIKEGVTEIVLPAGIEELLGGNRLELLADDAALSISSELLRSLRSLRDEAAAGQNARLSIHLAKQPDESLNGLLQQESERMKAGLRAAGNALDIRMEWITDAGRRLPAASPDESGILRFRLPSGADRELLGVYFIGNDGRLVYAGGKPNGEWMEAELRRTGQYMLLEYDKKFADVPSFHWASRVIKALSARHVIEGVNDTHFHPQSAVTRAEFTALLVRLLQLKPTGLTEGAGAVVFTDVPSGAWYAEAVASAAAAGLAEGTGGNLFMPEEEVSREQMAVMLLRAYEIKTGRKTGGANGSVGGFADQADISGWAQSYVRTAKAKGLIQGRESNRFAPQQPVNRAESAQAVYNLLGVLD